jgi:pyrroloquinoline quinone biosynthesis protein E
MPTPEPHALLAELTHACPLHCTYCSNPLELVRRSRELDTRGWKDVLRQAAELGVVQVHFSGGEPLLRRDLEELVAESVRLQLYPYLVTSAVPDGASRMTGLWNAGLRALQVSVQDAQREDCDKLAGTRSFDAKHATVAAAKSLGFHVTLNVVLERRNIDHVADIVRMAEEWKVDKLELAHAQLLGFAFENRALLAPTCEQLDRTTACVDAARATSSLDIVHVLTETADGIPRACLQGWGQKFLTVAPDGVVLPCQAARCIPDLELVNVRDHPLEWIWSSSPAFGRFRGKSWMSPVCRSCEHVEHDFAGCRCQAWLVTRDATAPDPACVLAQLRAVAAGHQSAARVESSDRTRRRSHSADSAERVRHELTPEVSRGELFESERTIRGKVSDGQ